MKPNTDYKHTSLNGHTIEFKRGKWYVDSQQQKNGEKAKALFKSLANPKRYRKA